MTRSDEAGPVAERRPVERVCWGETTVDDYGWLRDADDQEVLDHLKAENDHTETVLAEVAELQGRLFDEIKARIKETDLSVPVRLDDWDYYSRTVEGAAYPIHCRRPADRAGLGDAGLGDAGLGDAGDEVVLLDENVEAGDDEFFDVGPFDVSPDHELLFWGWDRTGDERYTATVRDLASGIDLDDKLEDVSYGSAWALDNRTLFYVRPDHTNRPFQVWRHRLGSPQADDELVYTEPDERFFVGVGLEKDRSYIQIGSTSKVTDEVWIIRADDPEAEPRLVAARRHGVEYALAHHGDRFVVRTNDRGHVDFTVMTAPEHDPQAGNWEPLAGLESGEGADGGNVTLSGFDLNDDYLILYERADGLTRIRVRRWDDGTITEIEQSESVSTVWPGANPDFASTSLRYGYGSMVSPASVYTVDLKTGDLTLLKQQEVLGGYEADRYETERTWATAPDGTRVPISLVWRGDRPAEPGPCLLYAYGAYEASMDPTFSAARLSLLDRGFIFALAHVRGGGEMGRHWYLDGKFENKHNTFDDLIACAEHLIETARTTPSKLVVRGGSAGGLTVGAALNEAPELFTAVVAEVPFVDVVNTMLDESLPLTVTEWEEWGNPADDEAAYRTMQGYAPYENIRAVEYPSIFATGGLHDTRVGFWEPVKWVQKLRATTTGARPILSWTDLGAGHGGPSGRYDSWREEARILAYILWAVGLTT
ncbi:MAG: S9 family peptidase [Acidimicrobiales bacterium]